MKELSVNWWILVIGNSGKYYGQGTLKLFTKETRLILSFYTVITTPSSNQRI
jgi:hypothetical protein